MPDPAIGVDLRMWRHPGIGRYIRELYTAMLRLTDASRYLFLAAPQDEQSIFTELGPVAIEHARSGIYSLQEQAELRSFSKKVRLLHVPHFNAPILCASKLVVTVHDLIYLKQAGLARKFYVRALIDAAARNASAVLTVSDYTRMDLEAAFPKLIGKTHVVHEAASFSFRPGPALPDDVLKSTHDIEKPFVLFVGSLKPHKNLGALLDAFGDLLRDGSTEAQLVIVGRSDPKEKALLDRVCESAPDVVYLGERSDEELIGLYRSARALVLPSFWEGFGLPAVEAMSCGTPVIVSNRASLPEVVEGAGLLFDPERVDQLRQLLYNVLNDSHLRQELSKKGLERARCFSWEKTARQTLQILEPAAV